MAELELFARARSHGNAIAMRNECGEHSYEDLLERSDQIASALLDQAEDPQKLIKLMIREMEDTLVELKAACAGVMAESKKVQRQLEEIVHRAGHWEDKAALAVRKGRDDLAREALIEKRR